MTKALQRSPADVLSHARAVLLKPSTGFLSRARQIGRLGQIACGSIDPSSKLAHHSKQARIIVDSSRPFFAKKLMGTQGFAPPVDNLHLAHTPTSGTARCHHMRPHPHRQVPPHPSKSAPSRAEGILNKPCKHRLRTPTSTTACTTQNPLHRHPTPEGRAHRLRWRGRGGRPTPSPLATPSTAQAQQSGMPLGVLHPVCSVRRAPSNVLPGGHGGVPSIHSKNEHIHSASTNHVRCSSTAAGSNGWAQRGSAKALPGHRQRHNYHALQLKHAPMPQWHWGHFLTATAEIGACTVRGPCHLSTHQGAAPKPFPRVQPVERFRFLES